jgi:hypothetical protein
MDASTVGVERPLQAAIGVGCVRPTMAALSEYLCCIGVRHGYLLLQRVVLARDLLNRTVRLWTQGILR